MIKSILTFLLTTASFLATSGVGATTVIIVNNDGPNEGFNSTTSVAAVAGNSATTLGAQYLNVFQAAADYWETKLDSDVPIRIQSQFDALFCSATSAQLGGAGPLNAFLAPIPGLSDAAAVTVAQANSLAGEDLDPGVNDVNATFNSLLTGSAGCLGGISWWLGIDSPAPAGTIALYDTVLHEIGHGVGFLTFVNQSGQRISNGVQSFDDVYMLNLFDVSQNRSWSSMSDTQRAVSSINTGGLVWAGGNVAEGAGVVTDGRNGGLLRMFAPNPFQGGSSVSHWDTTLSPDELMEPFATPTSNSCATVLALQDMGWRTRNECGNDTGAIIPPLFLLLDDE